MDRFAFPTGEVSSSSPFEIMLSPIMADEFFHNYWDCEPVFVAGHPGRFNDAMTEHDFCKALFDAKLGNRNLAYLQKSIGDRHESLDFFLRKKAAWLEPQSINQLATALPGGTLVYTNIGNAVPSVKSFCRSLFADLKCVMSVNAYLSAGRDASAFDAHFDAQDVFILQLEGEKEWRLWEHNRVSSPISGFPDQNSVQPPHMPADETILLTAGDLLHVPRGTWHWPRSLDNNPSLHLTLTLQAPKPLHVLRWLAQIMSKEEEFRLSLPLSKHQDGEEKLNKSLDRAIEFLSEKLASPDAKANASAHMLVEALETVMPKTSSTDNDSKEL